MKTPLRGFLTFLTIFLSIYGGAHLFLWWRLLHPLRLAGAQRWFIYLGFVALCVSFPIIHLLLRPRNGPLVTAANFVSSVWMGLVVYLVLVTLVVEIIHVIPPGAWKISLVAIVAGIITIYGLWEASSIVVTHLPVSIPRLPAHLEGFRIVQISDIHLGLNVRGSRLERIVTMVNDLHPDLIVITGDLVDAEALHMEDMVHPLKRLTAKYGTYAVTGNHEYYAGVAEAQRFIESAGVTLLRNRWVTIAGDLQLIGCDDRAGTEVTGQPIPPLHEIAKDIDRTKPAVLLLHTPATTLAELHSLGIDLQLSGHTHKGQLWPFNFIVKRVFHTPYGLFTDGNATIYVSRGTGTWGPPMRVGARPEITLVTLVPARLQP
jgi:predicted MPP superfamily phosphohydrolase